MVKIIPTMRYRDAPAAIEWLCRAFGFQRHLVVPGQANTINHAELSLGEGMVMLGSASESESGRLVRPPGDTGGVVTHTIYVVVPDVDAHYARARAAGAEIVIEPKDEDFGGRDYTCRDPEGHIWTFGTYDPWSSGPG